MADEGDGSRGSGELSGLTTALPLRHLDLEVDAANWIGGRTGSIRLLERTLDQLRCAVQHRLAELQVDLADSFAVQLPPYSFARAPRSQPGGRLNQGCPPEEKA
jgi:hypothetical protein